jgi:hypothetical protein
MIDTQKLTNGIAEAFRSGTTQEEIRERAQIPMAAFLADVTSAIESANGDDKVKIRQFLSEAKTGLKGIDFDHILVPPIEASAVRATLVSQIDEAISTI